MPKHLIHGQNWTITLIINKIMSQQSRYKPVPISLKKKNFIHGGEINLVFTQSSFPLN